MDIRIEEADLDDFKVLILFRLLLLKHDFKLDSSIDYSREKINKSISYMRKYLKKNDNKYFIAYSGSLPIGYLHVTYDDEKNKQKSYLSELYVIDLYRSLGIGKKLVLTQLSFLKKNKMKFNDVTTTLLNNDRTINFYYNLGYELVRKDEKENTIYLSKNLQLLTILKNPTILKTL